MKGIWLAVLAMLFAIGCGEDKIDVVNDVEPVSASLSSVAETMNAMVALPEGEWGAYLERNWPHLDEDVVFYLRRTGQLADGIVVERVEFRYGSLDDVWALDQEGERRHGYFRDQIIAVVYPAGGEPKAVIVQCLNGTFASVDELNRLQLVGSHTPIEAFTIGRGEGLIHYVDFPVAIDIAERFGLLLYRGRWINRRFEITPDEARRLEHNTDYEQVTVYVVEGDTFDLRRMIFTPSERRTKL